MSCFSPINYLVCSTQAKAPCALSGSIHLLASMTVRCSLRGAFGTEVTYPMAPGVLPMKSVTLDAEPETAFACGGNGRVLLTPPRQV